jgi:hypothetical protein
MQSLDRVELWGVPSPVPRSARHAAELLRDELAARGITADLHVGYGLALLSVWVDLVVWCDGSSYSWWAGRVCASSGRRQHAYSPASDPVTAAARVADRYADLQEQHPYSGRIREVLGLAGPGETGAPL